jgi:hypothetical protein
MAAYETVTGDLPTSISQLRPYTDGELGERWRLDVTLTPSTVVSIVGINDCAPTP